jgi:hypothetical protein
MANCAKCGGITIPQKGISKKNGKPWSGEKCQACGDFNFTKQQQEQNSPKVESKISNPENEKLKILSLAVTLACSSKEQATHADIEAYYTFLNNLLNKPEQNNHYGSYHNNNDEEVPF